MKPAQDLSYVTGAVLEGVTRILRVEQPDWLIVQGDTSTAFAAALAGFYERVPVAHVEAGLRTCEPMSPWPEETHRRLVASLASLHFAPTERAAQNLLREGIAPAQVVVTGNTVIDALRWTAAQPGSEAALDAMLARHAPALAKFRTTMAARHAASARKPRREAGQHVLRAAPIGRTRRCRHRLPRAHESGRAGHGASGAGRHGVGAPAATTAVPAVRGAAAPLLPGRD